jgi:3-deoxy-D-manno-octulosonic-acid transferase
VSVGEVLSAGPLIKRLRLAFPGMRFLVTTVTPTGAEMVSARFNAEIEHAYFPYDLPWAVGRFLARVRPRMVVVLETEIWPNFYAACHRAGIPLVMVNARISPVSFSGYTRFARLIADALANVTFVAAQTQTDADRFQHLGVAPARMGVFGNLKFDIQISRSVSEQGQALRRAFSNDRLIWAAASTHEGEETTLLRAFSIVLRTFPQCLLLLAPRHPERFDHVADLCSTAGFQLLRRSERRPPGMNCKVFLLDSLGELLPYYASSDVAFVGGSLVPAGGHNLLEPASLGVPLLTGPHTFNFTEVMSLLADARAVYVVRDVPEIAARVVELLGDANLRHAMGEAARRVFDGNQGTADRVVKLLVDLQTQSMVAGAPLTRSA